LSQPDGTPFLDYEEYAQLEHLLDGTRAELSEARVVNLVPLRNMPPPLQQKSVNSASILIRCNIQPTKKAFNIRQFLA
jgi:hypothetical protein